MMPLTDKTTSDFRRVTPRTPCPMCGNSRWCSFIGDWGVHCMRVEDGSRKPANGGGWIHVLDGHEPDWRELPSVSLPAPRRASIDADVIDHVFQVLLTHCPLSSADREHLRQRGLSDEQIVRHGYATWPDDSVARLRITSAVLGDLDQDPGGIVPGFIRHQTGTTIVEMPGILIPFRDVQGRIAGLQVRMRHPRDGAKYRWFSAGDKDGSVGQNGHAVHVTQPAGSLRTSWAVITEGAIKANIVADHFGCRALAVAGVTNTANVVATIQQLENVTGVIIAYDADADQNPHVAAAESKLASSCAEAGLRVAQWQWPIGDGKGIDDLLITSNLLPFPVPHPALAPCPVAATSPADPPKELAEVRTLHALSTQAHRSPNLGAERHVLTHLALALAAAPEDEAVAMPYPKLADIAGVSASTVERSLGKVGIRPRDGEAGLLEGLIAVEIRTVPERLNTQTGEITGGYEAMHIRRKAPVNDLLARIAQAPVPESGPRNGHGGKRCAKCGCTQITQTITERCAGCGEIIRQTTRTVDRGQETPPPQDAVESFNAEPAACDEDVSEDTTSPQDAVGDLAPSACLEDDPPPVTYIWDRKMRSTPPPQDAARSPGKERRAYLTKSLAAWQDHHLEDPPEDPRDVEAVGAHGTLTLQPLSMFPLIPPEECVACGATAASGQTYCHACDPRGT